MCRSITINKFLTSYSNYTQTHVSCLDVFSVVVYDVITESKEISYYKNGIKQKTMSLTYTPRTIKV